ncbi:hypothetical protein [Nostoc sp.]
MIQQCKLLADFPNMGQSCDNFGSGLRTFSNRRLLDILSSH